MSKRAWFLLCVLATTASCGKGAPPPPPTAGDVFSRAMNALGAGDLAALGSVLSPAGADQVRRDLEAWRTAVLVDPAEGPRVLSRLPSGPAAPPRALVEKALAGDPAALLALYVAIDPHPASGESDPSAAAAYGVPVVPGSPVLFLYAARDGSRRRVILTKYPDGWKVDLLSL